MCQAIVNQGGHYLFTVKDNQKTALRIIKKAILQAEGYPFLKKETRHAVSHGRKQTRHISLVPAPLALKEKYPGLRQVGIITRMRTAKAGTAIKTTTETVCFITSLSLSPAAILTLNQDHWKIENILHRCRDVHFKEDASSIHKDHAPENMTHLRAVALSCLKKQGKNITQIIEHFQRFPKQLLKLLTGN